MLGLYWGYVRVILGSIRVKLYWVYVRVLLGSIRVMLGLC